jgi:hypothetical protein
MKPFTMQSPPTSCDLILHQSKYSPQHPVLKHPRSMILPVLFVTYYKGQKHPIQTVTSRHPYATSPHTCIVYTRTPASSTALPNHLLKCCQKLKPKISYPKSLERTKRQWLDLTPTSHSSFVDTFTGAHLHFTREKLREA